MPARPIDERSSPTNRSVERALAILRAFRPGVGRLGNAELADRTGLARSTVSRLTQTLAESGFLDYDMVSGSYRLAAPVLSLAHALRLDSDILNFAFPLMRTTAEDHRINVGLAVADQIDMIYLESVRRIRRELFRHVTSGSRVPVELTSLGRAWLSTLTTDQLKPLMAQMRARHPDDWEHVHAAIGRSVEEVRSRGYCSVSWQTGITSIAAPLNLITLPPYVFNISFATSDFNRKDIETMLAPLLRELVTKVRAEFSVPASE
jgi:IclR family transcriptional regulator, positive regulator for flagellar biogenesis